MVRVGVGSGVGGYSFFFWVVSNKKCSLILGETEFLVGFGGDGSKLSKKRVPFAVQTGKRKMVPESKYTPLKTILGPQNGGLEDDFPFSKGVDFRFYVI